MSAREQWGDAGDVVITTVSELKAGDGSSPTDADVVLGAGVEGCRYAVERFSEPAVLCAILSQESFDKIRQQYPTANSSALVLDQPLSRLVAVTSEVFPALQKFSVLRSEEVPSDTALESTQEFLFNSRRGDALAPKVTLAVESTDALVAQPDRVVFNRNTIRTIMLTAYGHGKPIIGYSEAYVRAGALLATYSSIDQSFRHAAEILEQYLLTNDKSFTAIYTPRYFSIGVNSSIAKSLQLIQTSGISLERTWRDEDFPP